jgi:hypothetical protein
MKHDIVICAFALFCRVVDSAEVAKMSLKSDETGKKRGSNKKAPAAGDAEDDDETDTFTRIEATKVCAREGGKFKLLYCIV